MTATCPICGCAAAETVVTHAIAAALAEDDLDRALTLGLLDAPPCPECTDACRHRIAEARDARLAALAARERFHARQARLQRRALERATARAASVSTDATPASKPALPSAAAAALARAKARAAERHKP